MRRMVIDQRRPRLEGSCGPSPRDWIRLAPPQPGIERIEAFFVGHAFDPHRHDSYAIGLTMSGVQSFDYRGSRADSLGGNAIILHPDEAHDGRAGSAGGFRYRMLYLAPSLVRDALAERTRTLPFARMPVSSDRRLIAALRAALGDLAHSLEEIELTETVLAIAEALLALDGVQRPGGSALCAVAVEKARQLLDANFDRAVGAAELEAAAGLSRYELARHFRAKLGTSPHRYLTMRRLDHVRALVRAGKPLAEAGFAAGFADQSHMTRQFKRTYGLSPGRWRAVERGR